MLVAHMLLCFTLLITTYVHSWEHPSAVSNSSKSWGKVKSSSLCQIGKLLIIDITPVLFGYRNLRDAPAGENLHVLQWCQDLHSESKPGRAVWSCEPLGWVIKVTLEMQRGSLSACPVSGQRERESQREHIHSQWGHGELPGQWGGKLCGRLQ